MAFHLRRHGNVICQDGSFCGCSCHQKWAGFTGNLPTLVITLLFSLYNNPMFCMSVTTMIQERQNPFDYPRRDLRLPGYPPDAYRFISQHFREVFPEKWCEASWFCEFCVGKFIYTRTPYCSSTKTVLTNEALPWDCACSRESDRKEICSGRQIRDSLRMCWSQHRYGEF